MSLLEITLSNGWPASLQRFFQRETYADMMIGSPNRRVNEYVLGQLDRQAKEQMGDQPVVIIDPELTMNPDGEEELPPIVCMGDFEFYAYEAGTRTTLTIVWFEDAIEPHVSERNREKIKNVNWDE